MSTDQMYKYSHNHFSQLCGVVQCLKQPCDVVSDTMLSVNKDITELKMVVKEVTRTT